MRADPEDPRFAVILCDRRKGRDMIEDSDHQQTEDTDLYVEIGDAETLTRNGRASVTENNRGHG